MEKREEKETPDNAWVEKELVRASESGIPAYVDGVPYHEIPENSLPLVLENGIFMEDYLNDESGTIIQINFERIRHLQ